MTKYLDKEGLDIYETTVKVRLQNKQDKLQSGENIKTINSTSLLGSGDISVVATETDPVFSASAAHGITSTDISNWNAKMEYTELSSSTVRVWNLTTGLYLQTTSAYLYYNGESGTEKVRIGTGSLILVGGDSSRKEFLVLAGTCYVGYTTSTAGVINETLFDTDIVNNLTTSTTGSVLDASQGKALKDLIDGLAIVASTGDYDDLTNKPTIPTVPTTVSSFTNDAGYITSSSLSGYATTSDLSDVQDQVDANSANIISNNGKIGTLANLTTTTKTDLVSAVNEVNGNIPTNSSIVDLIYPVGSIYMSVNATSPETLFGGTWEQLKDRFLLGTGDTYTNGDTGGTKTVTLTVNQMPSHKHNIHYRTKVVQSGTSGAWVLGGSTYDGSSNSTNDAEGGGQAHNNMPPYLVVYMWKRTA